MSPEDIKEVQPLPKVPGPGNLEEHGISIPAPTPTAISMPNPWRPEQNGATQEHGSNGGNGKSADSGSAD